MRGQIYIILGSVFVAALLWFSVTMSGTYETKIPVQLMVTDIPEDRALRTPLPSSLIVTMKGSGWQLLFLKLGKGLVYELSVLDLKSDRYFLTKKGLGDGLKLSNNIEAIDVSPETLLISFDTYYSKKIPLVPKFALRCAEGYGQTGAVQLEPDSVSISGAESVLRNISSWNTLTAKFSNVSSDVLTLVDVSDTLKSIIRVSPKRVKLRIPVQQLADVEFKSIPVSIIGAPASKQVLLSPSSINIIARGGIHLMSPLNAENFSATVEYAVLLKDSTNTIIPQLTLPEGIQLLRIIPDSVRFTIRQ